MRSCRKYILFGLIILFAGGFYGLNADLSVFSSGFPEVTPLSEPDTEIREAVSNADLPEDTTKTRFPVAKIVPEEYKELNQVHPIDLQTPDFFNSGFKYNSLTNRYELRTKIGDSDVTTPLSLTPDEYFKLSLQRSMDSYYKEKYAEEFETGDDD